MKYPRNTKQGTARRRAHGPIPPSQFNPHTGLPHTAKHIALERRCGLRRERKAVLK